jgi:hypothetical protein
MLTGKTLELALETIDRWDSLTDAGRWNVVYSRLLREMDDLLCKYCTQQQNPVLSLTPC